jgi:plastocyanin
MIAGASFALTVLLATGALAADWGTLTGRFVYDGKAPTPAPIDTSKDPMCKVKLTDEDLLVDAKGGLANAVIILKSKNVPVNPAYESSAKDNVELDNKNCHFEPHVLVVRTSQTLLLKNSDPTGHNTNIASISNDGINPILAAGADPLKHKFAKPEVRPVKVGCNIHTWMGAWLIVRTDPYAAVSDKTGTFTIKDLPAGKELEFGLWHEKAGYLRNAGFKGGTSDSKGNFKYKIKPGENNLGDIKVSGSIFK